VKKLAIFALILAWTSTVFANNVNLVNGDLSFQTARAGKLGAQVMDVLERGSWAAWSVPIIEGQSWGCYNHEGERCSCSLDKNQNRRFSGMVDGTQARFLTIFLKAENGRVNRIELISDHCEIDAAGDAVTLFSTVDPGESIEFLSGLRNKSNFHEVVSAVALHDHELADETLKNFLDDENPIDLRRDAVFWMGQARGQRGYETLADHAFHNPDARLREHITFGLHTSKVPEARSTLMRMAREDEHSNVRQQAVFWLAQEGGDDVVALIHEMLEANNTGDVSRLTFALTQLPDNGGVPMLVNLVRNHENQEVRGQAIFWLGQEGAPEVFELIDEAVASHSQGKMVDQAMLTLSQTSDEKGLSALLKYARSHESEHVRSKALFWLGQKAGQKATETLMEAIDEDPNTGVKEQAVFAISQLPKEQAGPLLSDLARNHKEPAIRKKALFWLGQIGYEGAVDLFEDILTKE